MNSILKYLQQFYIKDFKLSYFLFIIIFMGVGIYLNYWHQLENRITRDGNTWWQRFLGYWFLYFIPFATAFLLQFLFLKEISWHKNYWFWIILFLAPAFFSLRVNFYFHQPILKNIWSGDNLVFWNKVINLVISVIVILIPVFIIWYIKDKPNQPFYGSIVVKNLTPYIFMLIMMIPVIALASTQSDFLIMYPKAKFIEQLSLSSKKLHYIIYELCYGLDFLSIEFFLEDF